MDTKQCKRCGAVKPLQRGPEGFPANSRSKDGFGAWCSECKNDHQRRYYSDNADRERAYQNDRYALKGEEIRESVRSGKARRRAIAGGVAHEPYTAAEIFARDEWLCQVAICLCPEGRSIDPQASARTPWSKTIDHVIPQALGGPDTPGNVVAAHHRCNSVKQDKILEPQP